MFNLQTTTRNGPLSLDLDGRLEKSQRAKLTIAGAVCLGDSGEGSGALRSSAPTDPANAIFWKHDPAKSAPRGAWGSWSFAIPAVTHTDKLIRPYGAVGSVDEDFLPLFEGDYHGDDQVSFLRRGFGAADSRFAAGTEFVVTSTTGHGTHQKLAAPVGGPLVASHGDLPEYSRHVFDVHGGTLSAHGPLHSHLRVVDCVKTKQDHDGHIPAWNLSAPGPRDFGSGGRGAFVSDEYSQFTDEALSTAFPLVGRITGRKIGAFASVLGGGPLHTGGVSDKHRLGVADDGTFWNPGHLSTGAIWYADSLRDGPQEFTRKIYPKNLQYSGFYSPVEQQFDPFFDYVDVLGRRQRGAWRWVARTPFVEADPPEVLKQALIKRVENVNVNVNVNINWGFWWIPFPVPINPGNGDPIDIGRLPQEVGVPSLHGTAIRRREQDYDGRFGGTGGALPPQDKIVGSDPDNLAGSGPGSVDRLFDDPLNGAGGSDSIDGNPHKEALRLRNAEPDLSDVDQRPWPLRSPVVWSIHSIGAVSSTGEADATFSEGEFFKYAPTTDGVLWFTPPEIVPDAEEKPRTTSAVTFSVYNGLWHEDGSTCGVAAKFGFLSPSQETGTGSDGWYLTATGASSAVNAELHFVDAAGAARNGVLSHYGTLVGGNDGANIGMGDRSVTAVTDAGTDLATVGTDEQLRRYTFAEKAGGYTYNLDLDTTGAVLGATFEFDLELAVVGVGNTTTVLIRNGSGGSTLATVTSAISGAIKRWCKAYYNGSAWVLTALVANLT